MSTSFEISRAAIEELRVRASGSRLGELVAWYPSVEDYQEMLRSSENEKAVFIAETLGHWEHWRVSTGFIYTCRVPDEGAAPSAERLGLSYEQSQALRGMLQHVSMQLSEYTTYLIEDVLQGNLSLLATKIRTVGQALAFSKLIRREPVDEREKGLLIKFRDGTGPITSFFDAITYLDELQKEIPIVAATYDPQEQLLQIQFRKADTQLLPKKRKKKSLSQYHGYLIQRRHERALGLPPPWQMEGLQRVE